MRTEREVLSEFKEWAESNNLIRAAVLTSSRALPGSNIDFLSDYDIELYVSDISTFEQNDNWLEAFGPIMVRWPYKPRSTGKENWITRLVLFKDGLRIDFQITEQFDIKPDTYDNGYRVLIDKDNLLKDLMKPTFTEYVIKKPSKEEYETLVNEFWWDAYYVPKYLWREEITFAKYMLDYILKYLFMHKIIEWYIGMHNNWSVDAGVCGKKFKKYLDSNTWVEFEQTYVGADLEQNWNTFINSTEFFRKIAIQVGENLGYEYPIKLDEEVMKFCLKIRDTDKDR